MKKDFDIINLEGNIEGIVESYDKERKDFEDYGKDLKQKKKKFLPSVNSKLRHRSVLVPEAIYDCSGIVILGKRIKSILFTTDIALIKNNNANAIMAVYPFTPQIDITKAIVETASVPVFAGIGGGTTTGERSIHLGLQAELWGAYGVVVNAPMDKEIIREIARVVDIPVIATVVSERDDFLGKIEAGASILNVSGGRNTCQLLKYIRSKVGKEFPIIATGGHKEENIIRTIEEGANRITYTPPSTAEIFQTLMEEYRNREN